MKKAEQKYGFQSVSRLAHLSAISALFTVVFASASFLVGCNDPMPSQLEPTVKMQSKGLYTTGTGDTAQSVEAIILIQEIEGQPLSVELKDSESQKLLGTAFFDASVTRFDQLLLQARGPLKSEVKGTFVKVDQSAKFALAMGSVSGESVGDSTYATFEFEGSRRVTYQRGLLDSGLDGSVVVAFRASDDAVRGYFSGMTALVPIDAKGHSTGLQYLATELPGMSEGSLCLGGTVFGGGNLSRLQVNTINGALRFHVQGTTSVTESITDFDPATDMTSTGEAKVTESAGYIEIEDEFQATLNLNHIRLCNDQVGKGTSVISYKIKVGIDPMQVRVTGEATMQAKVRANDGSQQLEFKSAPLGSPAGPVSINRTIDW